MLPIALQIFKYIFFYFYAHKPLVSELNFECIEPSKEARISVDDINNNLSLLTLLCVKCVKVEREDFASLKLA